MQSSIGERCDELRGSLEREAHLWLSDLDLWQAAPLLSDDDEDRVRTLRHTGAKASFVAGRSLARYALSHYARVAPLEWRFEAHALGRPEITGPAGAPALRFNLTHTPGLAACVVTSRADCGIDVEVVERPLKPLRIAEHSFAPEELADLVGREPMALRERFFAYWTLKEAYYKACGSGIPFRMTGARFDLVEPAGITFSPADDDPSGWQFALFRPGADHILALALRADRALSIRCFSQTQSSRRPDFAFTALEPVRSTLAAGVPA